MKLTKALILPFFTYGSVIFPKLDGLCQRKILIAFNDCARFLFGLRRFDHVSLYTIRLLGCSLDSFLKRRALVVLFKLMQSGRPDYLFDHLQFLQSSRRRDILIPRHSRRILEDSFFVQIPRLWNTLPSEVKSVDSLGAFKRLLFDNLL